MDWNISDTITINKAITITSRSYFGEIWPQVKLKHPEATRVFDIPASTYSADSPAQICGFIIDGQRAASSIEVPIINRGGAVLITMPSETEGDTFVNFKDVEFKNNSAVKVGTVYIDGEGKNLSAKSPYVRFFSRTEREKVNVQNSIAAKSIQPAVDLSSDPSRMRFESNFASQSGGALFTYDTNVEIKDAIFDSNEGKFSDDYDGDHGGAITIKGNTWSMLPPLDSFDDYRSAAFTRLRNGEEYDNVFSGETDYKGSPTLVKIVRSHFDGNYSYLGGAIAATVNNMDENEITCGKSLDGYTGGHRVEIYQCSFDNNWVGNYGGDVIINGVGSNGSYIHDSVFTNSQTEDDGSSIANMCFAALKVENSAIISSVSNNGDSAIYTTAHSISVIDNVDVIECQSNSSSNINGSIAATCKSGIISSQISLNKNSFRTGSALRVHQSYFVNNGDLNIVENTSENSPGGGIVYSKNNDGWGAIIYDWLCGSTDEDDPFIFENIKGKVSITNNTGFNVGGMFMGH